MTAVLHSKAFLSNQSTLLQREKGQGVLIQPEAGEDG